MTYAKYTFFLLVLTFILLLVFVSGWYESILSGAKPYEFLLPMLISLWIVLQFQAKTLMKKPRILQVIKLGLISGTACGLGAWIFLLLKDVELLVMILEEGYQYGRYALVLLFVFQIILGGWLIGVACYFAVREGCLWFNVRYS